MKQHNAVKDVTLKFSIATYRYVIMNVLNVFYSLSCLVTPCTPIQLLPQYR